MISRVIATLTLLATVLLVAIFYTSTPTVVGPMGIIVVFILIYLIALGVLTFCLYGLSNLIKIMHSLRNKQSTGLTLDLKLAYYYASVLALAPVLFVAMQSVGRLAVYEIGLVVIFEVIACVYITKRHA